MCGALVVCCGDILNFSPPVAQAATASLTHCRPVLEAQTPGMREKAVCVASGSRNRIAGWQPRLLEPQALV
jgi:hypothetical protein